MTRDELNAKAIEAGITDPEKYPNAKALEEAIDSAASSSSAGAGNDTIPHTDEDAPLTTRSDATDLGVPMAPAADPAAERVGPEDALDPNARGDYSGRLREGPIVRMDPVPAGERQDVVREDADGNEVVERGPNVKATEVAPGR